MPGQDHLPETSHMVELTLMKDLTTNEQTPKVLRGELLIHRKP